MTVEERTVRRHLVHRPDGGAGPAAPAARPQAFLLSGTLSDPAGDERVHSPHLVLDAVREVAATIARRYFGATATELHSFALEVTDPAGWRVDTDPAAPPPRYTAHLRAVPLDLVDDRPRGLELHAEVRRGAPCATVSLRLGLGPGGGRTRPGPAGGPAERGPGVRRLGDTVVDDLADGPRSEAELLDLTRRTALASVELLRGLPAAGCLVIRHSGVLSPGAGLARPGDDAPPRCTAEPGPVRRDPGGRAVVSVAAGVRGTGRRLVRTDLDFLLDA